MTTVQTELEHRHGDDPRWQTAQEQSGRMGALLTAGEVRGRLLVVQPVNLQHRQRQIARIA